jgi:hypothetical protein
MTSTQCHIRDIPRPHKHTQHPLPLLTCHIPRHTSTHTHTNTPRPSPPSTSAHMPHSHVPRHTNTHYDHATHTTCHTHHTATYPWRKISCCTAMLARNGSFSIAACVCVCVCVCVFFQHHLAARHLQHTPARPPARTHARPRTKLTTTQGSLAQAQLSSPRPQAAGTSVRRGLCVAPPTLRFLPPSLLPSPAHTRAPPYCCQQS